MQVLMMRYKSDMLEFVYGKCEAMKEPRKFIHDWITTDRNPCSVCGNDKSKCSFYKELVAKGVLSEEENPP